MRRKIKKFLLTLFGMVFVVLGVVGAVLPMLPTTPFLLLALACFANSSPRFHQMLLNHRWFGSILRQWEENRSITRAAKRKAMILIILTFAVSIGILDGNVQLQLGLWVMGTVLLAFMWKLKETEAISIGHVD